MHLRLSPRQAATVIGAASLLYLVSTTYTPLNGTHVWRQADAFAQILGFSGFKGMEPLQLFNQGVTVFDTPIYEWLAAGLARITSSDPLVSARLINDAVWPIFLVAGYRLADRALPGAGLLFVLFAATSPVFLQYFAAPIPDGMAVTASLLAVELLDHSLGKRSLIAAAALLIIAALIKSPIPFVFLVFFGVRLLMMRSVGGVPLSRAAFIRLLLPFGAAAAGTVGAELVRKWVMHPTPADQAQSLAWYFGTWSTRMQPYFWQTMLDRTTAEFASPALVAVVLVAMVLLLVADPGGFARTVVPAGAGFLAGWLVFANVFLLHDYYEMGVATLVMVAGAVVTVRAAHALRSAPRPELGRWRTA